MKKVSRVDEFENVTGIINLYQLLINLHNLEISLEILFEKLTLFYVLNCCKVRPLLSF